MVGKQQRKVDLPFWMDVCPLGQSTVEWTLDSCSLLFDPTCLPALEDPGPCPIPAAPPLPDPGTGGLLAFPESTPDPMPDSF